MTETLQFVVLHGYTMVFAWVFVEQAGLPVPSAPLLLAAGALSGMHQMNLAVVLALGTLGCIASDSMWYELGRLRGVRVLQFLCKISLEPDSCVRRTQISFTRNGPRVLMGAKFVPGLGAMSAPLAGIIKMGWRKVLMYDAVGALAWVGSYVLTGFIFSKELDRVAQNAAHMGESLLIILIGGFGGYIL